MYFFEESPIFKVRLVADRGWIMNGTPAVRGSPLITIFMRSCTRCRASMMSSPLSKRSTICDSPPTDSERRVSRPGTPRSAFSIGIVTSSSTSAAVIPGPSV